jgi:polysaccharide deacetylase family protein (PEP-CTERM system associated)
MPDAPRFPYHPSSASLLEIPLSTLRLGGRNLPIGGGGYFRLLPYAVSRWALERLHRGERRPAVFYLHPWEIDPGQRRIEGIGAKSRFRHYVNLRKTEPRLERLLEDFRWGTIRAVFDVALGHERLVA